MIQLAVQLIKRFVPQVMLPITITIGFIGYSIESYFRKPVANHGSESQSVIEIREERRLRDIENEKKG